MVILLLAVATALPACATLPTGPSVMVLPGQGKSFDQFRADDALCRQFAYEQIGGVAGKQAAQKSAVTSAVAGTAVGTAAGAAIGSASGNLGAGAAIGAGAGLLLGSAIGSGYASESYYEAQRRYDYAYMQCMYAKGNQLPGTPRYTNPSASGQPESPPPDFPPPYYQDDW